ncbi:MAG: methyltransferase domain-containing protein [Actinobacteria bacterium]|nr:methyltransferase domain-containing protein [Actinomycetota bacterium]
MLEFPAQLLNLTACPTCLAGELAFLDQGREKQLECRTCAAGYPVTDGVASLLPHLTGDGGLPGDHKGRQSAFFDEGAGPEYETTRPHGTVAFHRFLISEKLRRSVAALGSLAGRSALVVCGGSGMEAEFLARADASVITSDLSRGAAGRALERARRYGVPLVSVVADAERLPFKDGAVDLVYVHDGLHHLEEPSTGLAEMARVAGWAVSVTEPALAAATALAVRAGLALEQEEAGNRVARLTLEEVARGLEGRGFRVVTARRYAMFYRHRAGPVARLLSKPPLFPAARAGYLALDAAIARLGNKLVVQAVRV